jgi:hypothetical protein
MSSSVEFSNLLSSDLLQAMAIVNELFIWINDPLFIPQAKLSLGQDETVPVTLVSQHPAIPYQPRCHKPSAASRNGHVWPSQSDQPALDARNR